MLIHIMGQLAYGIRVSFRQFLSLQALGKLEVLLTCFVVDANMDSTQLQTDFGKVFENSEANPAKVELAISAISVLEVVCLQIQGPASWTCLGPEIRRPL